MSGESIIEKAETFFYFDDTLCNKIEKWAEGKCSTFTSSKHDTNEQPLAHMTLFTEYVDYVEVLLQGFLKTEGISVQEFYVAVREEYETAKQKRRENSTFSSILLGTLEFSTFCEIMHGVREGRCVVFCPPLVDADDEYFQNEHEGNSFKADSKENNTYVSNSPGRTYKSTEVEDKDNADYKESSLRK